MSSSQQNNRNMEKAAQIAQSPQGQQLLALLKKQQGPKLQQAINSAAQGDYQKIQNLLRSFLADPQVQELLRKLGG